MHCRVYKAKQTIHYNGGVFVQHLENKINTDINFVLYIALSCILIDTSDKLEYYTA